MEVELEVRRAHAAVEGIPRYRNVSQLALSRMDENCLPWCTYGARWCHTVEDDARFCDPLLTDARKDAYASVSFLTVLPGDIVMLACKAGTQTAQTRGYSQSKNKAADGEHEPYRQTLCRIFMHDPLHVELCNACLHFQPLINCADSVHHAHG